MPRNFSSLLSRLVPALFLLVFFVPAAFGTAGISTPTRAASSDARNASPLAADSATPTGTATATATAISTMTATATATATSTAHPTVTVNPTTVASGDKVTVSGSGYQAGEQIDIQLASSVANGGTLHLVYTTADANGNFSAADITIPSGTVAATYQIVAIGQRSARSAQTALQVTAPKATLTVTPTTFSPEDDIQVSGTNFAPGEMVTITLSTSGGTASVTLGQVKADTTGSFGPSPLHVPFGVPSGALQLVATGQTSVRQAMVNVTVNAPVATLKVDPTSVVPNNTVALTGAHFQPGETVTVDLVALSSNTHLATVQANSAGSFTVTNVKIPQNTPEGTVSLVATGTTSHLSATAALKVGALPATVTITPATITPGATVSVTGKGYIPGETVIIQLTGGKLPPLTLASAVVGTDGSFTISKLTIPTFVPAGSYSIVVSGQTSGRSMHSTLAVQAPPPAAPILSVVDAAHVNGTPYQLSPGGLVQVAGSNFPASATVMIALVGTSGSIVLGNIKATPAGAFGVTGLTLPANTPAGTYTLEALVSGTKVASVDAKVVTLTPHITTSTGTLTPGATLTVQGTGFAPGEQIVLALNGAALVTKPTAILANANGAFTVTVVVPATVTNGTNILTATGGLSRASATINLQASLPIATRFYFPHGDTTADHRTVISLLNPGGAAAGVKMTFLYQAGLEHSYRLSVPAHSEASVDLALAAGAGRFVSTIVEADRQIGAQSTIYYGGGDTSTALGASAPGTTWYLAEGYTGGSFRESVDVMNPNSSFATVDVRFLPFNGRPPREVRFSVNPRSVIRIDAGQYMPAQSISTIVTSDKGVVVERSMRFGLNRRGAHDKIGTVTASTVWLFAQGITSGDRQTFLSILNPNQAAPAAVTATFFDGTGKPVGATTVVINPLRRGNIKINDVLANADVAVVLTSNVPVVAERPQYEGPANLGVARSGSDIFGRNGGAASWLFPGGTTANGNLEQIYLFNPGLKAVQVTATFYTSLGATLQQSLTLAPNSRSTLSVNGVAGLPAGQFGAVLKSTNGQVFVAEQLSVNATAQSSSSTQGIAQ